MQQRASQFPDAVEEKLRCISKKLDNVRKIDKQLSDHFPAEDLSEETDDVYDSCRKRINAERGFAIRPKKNRHLYSKRTSTFMDSYSKYSDSRVFLKGLTTQNIQNDFSQYFVDTGRRPQNYIRDTSVKSRYSSYPKLKELIRLKDEVIDRRRTPSFYLKADLRTFKLSKLSNEFDVILIDPPLNEYKQRNPFLRQNLNTWTWDEVKELDIGAVASPKSFLFMWCGSKQGLEKGRECFKKWGFRRCEDICWLKTDKTSKNIIPSALSGNLLHNIKEHLLMGIKGTVRRNVDVHLIHTNIDLDVVVDEEKSDGSMQKPNEIYRLIEHFSLSRRRLSLFGNQNSIRDGWVVVSNDLECSNYTPEHYNSYIENDGVLIGSTPEIEQLRPKSPVQKRSAHIPITSNLFNSNPFMLYRM